DYYCQVWDSSSKCIF
nr:immunoglobulin light chain junction region [Macaca mulatta]